jgi:hypothetical protein
LIKYILQYKLTSFIHGWNSGRKSKLERDSYANFPSFLQLHLGLGFEAKMILIIFYIFVTTAFEKELELAVSVWDCIDSVSNSS